MKDFFLKMLLPNAVDVIIDILVVVLRQKAGQTKSKVDDELVKIISREKDEIKYRIIEIAK